MNKRFCQAFIALFCGRRQKADSGRFGKRSKHLSRRSIRQRKRACNSFGSRRRGLTSNAETEAASDASGCILAAAFLGDEARHTLEVLHLWSQSCCRAG